MASNYEQTEKILVGLAIEHTLLQIGKPMFDRVESQFREKYQCSIIDCYDYPQYLNEILRNVFGKAYPEVIKSIEEFLKEFRYEQAIDAFLKKINPQ
ncbi:MAG: hypothetical protein KGH89_07040 [Thaumarchaeota archaeon]|nr:hypothetical protein [Nitrososphaerota archaeon]